MKNSHWIFFFLIHYAGNHFIHGTPFWKKVININKPMKAEPESKPAEGENLEKIDLNLPSLPPKLTFEKTYDFFEGIPEKLHPFAKHVLHFPDFPNKAEVITSLKKLDPRGHVTEGQINGVSVILKRSKSLHDKQNDRENFYALMDVVKEKLNELTIMENGNPSPEEGKNFIGLGNIVPIVGIAKFKNETIEISPKLSGYILGSCIEKKLPPYNTLLGLPRNQKIVIHLLRQLTSIHLALRNCNYMHNDPHSKNIIVFSKGTFFSLKLFDWEKLNKIKDVSFEYIHNLFKIFYYISLGKNFIKRIFSQEIKPTLAENFRKKFFHDLMKTRIYSPEIAEALAELFSNMLCSLDDQKPTLEEIILCLEQLPINESKNEEKSEDNKNKMGHIKGEKARFGPKATMGNLKP